MELEALKSLASVAGDVLLTVILVKGGLLAILLAGLGLALSRASAAARGVLWMVGTLTLLGLPVLAGALPVWGAGVAQFPVALFGRGTATAAGAPFGLPLIAWLVAIWAVGAAALAGRFGVHALGVAVVTRRSRPLGEGRLARIAREVAAGLGVARVRVALRTDSGVPLAWGLARPVVLLPAEAVEWPEPLQRAVLQHELAHVARRDYLTLVAMELCRALHWPNPLVWHLVRRARLDLEKACDDAAIRSGIDAADYARHLVAVARGYAVAVAGPGAALPMARASSLRGRVRAVLARDAERGPAGRRTAAAVLTLVVALALPLAAANPWICSPQAEPPPVAAAPGEPAADPPGS